MGVRRFSISLRFRVAAIGVVGLLGVSFVGGCYLIGMRAQAEHQRIADAAATMVALARKVNEDLLRARVPEKEFMLSNDEAILGEHERAVGDMRTDLTALSVQLAGIGANDLANQARELGAEIEDYRTFFSRAVAAKRNIGLSAEQGLAGAIRDNIGAVETALAGVGDARAVAALQPLRRYEREYMLHREPSAREGFTVALAAFEAALAEASLPPGMRETVTGKVTAYVRAFDEWASTADKIASISVVTDAKTSGINLAVEQIKTNAEKLYADALAANTVEREATRLWILSAMGIALVAVAALALLIGLSISRPLAAMTTAMRRLAKGELDLALPGLNRRDEIGEMAQAVEGFKKLAAEKANAEAAEREQLSRAAGATRKAEMTRLADHFESAVGEIVTLVSSASSQLQGSADRLSKTAETTEQLSTVVASASTEASSNVQTVAAAADELAASVAEIARQVEESSRIAAHAVEQAGKTDQRMSELATLASRVGDVVKFISAIAGQTNLLALNATIEAARAGNAGRGFAVVAQEVKALAGETAKATGEISAQIAAMQAATHDSVGAIKEIGQIIQQVSGIATSIAASVSQQGVATAQIARNVQEAAKGTVEVARTIGDVSRGASDTGAASSEVLNAAISLAGESSHLKCELESFLETIRAA